MVMGGSRLVFEEIIAQSSYFLVSLPLYILVLKNVNNKMNIFLMIVETE